MGTTETTVDTCSFRQRLSLTRSPCERVTVARLGTLKSNILSVSLNVAPSSYRRDTDRSGHYARLIPIAEYENIAGRCIVEQEEGQTGYQNDNRQHVAGKENDENAVKARATKKSHRHDSHKLTSELYGCRNLVHHIGNARGQEIFVQQKSRQKSSRSNNFRAK